MEIRNRSQLRHCLAEDKKRTELGNPKRVIRGFLCHEPYYRIWQYIRAMRMEEYHTACGGWLHKLLHYYWRRRRHLLGERTNLFVEPGVFDEGLMIWHFGVIVNSEASVGKFCTFYGQNCIGNSTEGGKAPVLGDRVTLGTGASVLGDVHLADGIFVAAGAVVTDSFEEPDIVIGGIPARKLKGPGEREKAGRF